MIFDYTHTHNIYLQYMHTYTHKHTYACIPPSPCSHIYCSQMDQDNWECTVPTNSVAQQSKGVIGIQNGGHHEIPTACISSCQVCPPKTLAMMTSPHTYIYTYILTIHMSRHTYINTNILLRCYLWTSFSHLSMQIM